MELISVRCADRLRRHNLKVTSQRVAITEALELHGHLTIDQLYKILKREFTSLSLATIYKNIHKMIENSLLLEVKIPMRKSVYEIAKHHHSHFYCSVCHRIEDVVLSSQVLYDALEKQNKFHIETYNLTVIGRCQKC